MSTRIIALEPVHRTLAIPTPAPDGQDEAVLLDRLGRPLRDLRISVTDRCNFRCTYCMPKSTFGQHHQFLPKAALLSFEEIERLARVFASLGVRKIRLTGGEPLLRKDLEQLVAALARLRTAQGEGLDLALTTNGSMLARKAALLRAAGLQRLTVSLDALTDATFRRMNDVDFPVASVLDGIDASISAGFAPIKVNMVVKRGTNDHEIVPMARYFRERYKGSVVLRFIEYMDVGASNGWRMDEVLPSQRVLELLQIHFPLERADAAKTAATARRWRYTDGAGEIGLISSVTQAFCGTCCRVRLSADGRLFCCLFAAQGYDLRDLLRSGGRARDASSQDGALAVAVRAIWRARTDRYSELRGTPQRVGANSQRVEMHYIGG
jgi:cyclic pyranopterin phosphate synthase